MEGITAPIIAITLVLLSVFVPVAFLVATLHMFFQSYSPFLYFQF